MIAPQAVVAFAGRRDEYQLPLALYEGNLLDTLVTDAYAPLNRAWFRLLTRSSRALEELAAKRYHPGLPNTRVTISPTALTAFALGNLRDRDSLALVKDRALGRRAQAIAAKHQSTLFVYSYYAHASFSKKRGPLPYRFIFQLHPHPREVRRILSDELELSPLASDSLRYEYELGLSGADFERLAQEPHLANGWVVASSFCAHTLTAQGIPDDKIHIVPYGVDLTRYSLRPHAPRQNDVFTIIFVGSMIQRKGLSYLLDAVRLLRTRHLKVALCGRGYRDSRLIAQYPDLPIELHIGLSRAELVRKIQQADVMVFPSLAEGFAHVVIETMACGVPVITTPNTCGPDVIADGIQGFILPIRSAEAIADKIAWGMDNRSSLVAMGHAAHSQARIFSWKRFREGIRDAYHTMVSQVE